VPASRGSSRRTPVHVPRQRAVVAWRFWGIAADESGTFRLRSPFRATTWPVAEPFAAQCYGSKLSLRSARESHEAPGADCRCGVYGGKYRELRRFLAANVGQPNEAPVLGRVYLWGDVYEDDISYRASFGYPERLLVPTLLRSCHAIARDLEAYGAPVRVIDVGETYGTLHPETRVQLVRTVG